MKNVLPSKKGNFFKINVTTAFIVTILFIGSSNEVFGQAATATWNLTSNGSGSITGAVTATSLATGSGIHTATYSTTDGVTSDGWSNDAASLKNSDYYEYKVTATPGNKLTVSSVALNHSVSVGSWLGAVYYSYDGFATAGVQIGSNFISATTSQTAFNSGVLSLSVPIGGSFSIRVYAWESDGNGRKFRNRNVVISGTTCQTVTYSPQPLPQNLCVGATLNFTPTINNANSYQWYKNGTALSGATAASYSKTNVVSGDAGNYYVIATGSCGGAIASNTVAVLINALPITSAISGSNSVCTNSAGVAYTVTNIAGSSYAWTITGGTQVSGTTTNSITVNWGATGSGNVSVVQTSAAGCVGTAVNRGVTINALPITSAITGSNSVCASSAGVAYNVTNTIGSSYAWAITGGTQVSGTNSNSITVNWGAAGSGNVSVVETNTNGCIGTAVNHPVTLFTLPTTSAITGSNSVCAGSAGVVYNVTNTAGSSYAWSITGGTQVSGTTTNSITVNWSAAGSGNVSVVETNANGCVGTAVNRVVTINGLPTTTAITGSNSVCAGSAGVAYNIINTAGSSYAWTITGGIQASGGTTDSITINWGVAGSGNVSVVETNANGCVGTAVNHPVTITANSTPTASLTSSDLDNTFAYSTSVTFTASAGSLEGGTASYNFKVNGVSAQSGASDTYIVSNLANSDQVCVVVTVSGGTCLTSTTATSNTITNTVTGAYNSVITAYCGQTLPIINAKIRCSVPTGLPGGATLGYMVKVRNAANVNNVAVTFPSSVANFNLTMCNAYTYNTVFEVQVAAVVNGVVQPYSAICLITTPGIPANTVTEVQCGATLTELSTRIYASAVLGSQLYRWRVALSTAPTTYYTYTSLSSSFRLTNVVGLPVSFGKTYKVAVQSDVLINGLTVTSPYSTECNVVTPSIATITSAQCGNDLSAIDQRIFINSIIGANQYTYRVALASAPTTFYEFTTAVTNFRLTSVPSLPLTFATAYLLSVKVRLTIDGQDYFSDYSNPCTITTPEPVTVGLEAAYCTDGNVEDPGPYQVPTVGSLIYCEFVSGAYYTFVLQQVDASNNSIGSPITSVLRSVNNIKLQNIPGVVADAFYKVAVILTYFGEGEAGKGCTIHTPAAVARENDTVKVTFSARAYPNPFANNFMIDVKTRSESVVSLKVYDMIGRLVEERSVSVSNLETTPIGDNYPSGVYNVVVTQGDEVKTVRAVKR